MTSVIKLNEAASRIAPLRFGRTSDPPSPIPPPPDPVLARLEAECESLQTALAKVRQDLETASGQSDTAFERGRAAGCDEFTARDEQRIAILAEAAEKASAAFSDRLASLDRLAPLLARACLDKLFADQAGHADLVGRLLAAQLDRIETQAIVCIRVSAEDFLSTDALAAVAAEHAGRRLDVRSDPTLSSGECHIALTLGSMEIGFDQQWGRLAALLDDLAMPPVAP